jgi:hypothetical protein
MINPDSPSPEEWCAFEAQIAEHGVREALLFDSELQQLRLDQERILETTNRIRKQSKRIKSACYGISTIPTLSMIGFAKSIIDNEPLPLKLFLGTLSVGSGVFCANELGKAQGSLDEANEIEQDVLRYDNYRLPEL